MKIWTRCISTTILSLPKRKDEFRVFLIGDSSAWGFQLHPEETLVGQLNTLNLKTCDGKQIVVYNAAFPLPYVMKDLLIMDKVREYKDTGYVSVDDHTGRLSQPNDLHRLFP